MRNPWTTHESRVVYDNPWIQVTQHQVTQPGGIPGIYGQVHMKNVATGIVVLDGNYTWLVGQWRYTLNAYSWEIPEGGASGGEEPLQAAQRELLEETGLAAERWESLMTVHTSNSVTDEVAEIFLARQVRKVADPQPEPSEELQVKRILFAEALEMIDRGEITDSVSVAGLLQAARQM